MRNLAGMQRVIGFGSSMALLAVASLLIIPTMMRASGAVAWGAVALGQSVGSVASVCIGYGWNMAGPAQIAGAGATEARLQFLDSLLVRLVLFVPIAAVAAGISAYFAAPGNGLLAAIGAVFSASIGLSANWYFVGMVQPWTLLVTETVPRVLGTLFGMALMDMGHTAFMGVAGQLVGMLVAVLISGFWIFRKLGREGAENRRPTGVLRVLTAQRDGVLASVAGSAMGALPVVIVAQANPAAQPLFAFVDKLQRQMQVALTPFVTVLQGWTPRGDRRSRSRQATLWGMLLCLGLTGVIALLAPELTQLLGAGVLQTPLALNVGMAVYVGLGTYELIMSHVVLPVFHRLRFVAGITLATGILGLVLIIPASRWWGALGALGAVLATLGLRCAMEVPMALTAITRAPRRAAQ